MMGNNHSHGQESNTYFLGANGWRTTALLVMVSCFVDPFEHPDPLPVWSLWLDINVILLPPLLFSDKMHNSNKSSLSV